MISTPTSGPSASAFSRLVNVALHKAANQSSLSIWSQPDEAGNAVSGEMPADFAFHTAKELRPWWRVDLGTEYPIEAIVIANRLTSCRERARSLRVEVSVDGSKWTLLHAGLTVFGSAQTGDPFVLWLKGVVVARHILLSLDREEVLHLSQVEVLVKEETLAFSNYCRDSSLTQLYAMNSGLGRPYRINKCVDGLVGRVIGLDVSYSARFGNLIIQYINAVVLAKKTGLEYIRLGRHPLLDVHETFEAEGITFLPATEPLPSGGCFLEGDFFVSDPFVPVLMPFLRFTPEDERAFTKVAHDIIRTYMLRGIPLPDEHHFDDEVTVHLRSGDVFAPYTPVVRGYRQPPLAFYKLVISELYEEHGVRRARLVYEDRGNPCVDALEAWLQSRRIPVRLQSGSLHQDMSALIDAPHLIFGHGTFGYAACRLSRHIKTLHYFEPELGGAYGSIGVIDQVFSVSDTGAGYIKAFEYAKPFAETDGWFNTLEQRALMLSYPVNALSVRALSPPTLDRSS